MGMDIYTAIKKERFNLKIAWDIDLKTRLAGGTPKEEAKDFITKAILKMFD